jgi:hypothetical protein
LITRTLKDVFTEVIALTMLLLLRLLSSVISVYMDSSRTADEDEAADRLTDFRRLARLGVVSEPEVSENGEEFDVSFEYLRRTIFDIGSRVSFDDDDDGDKAVKTFRLY